MAIEIVTGYQGKQHVTANDIGGFQQGVVGTGDYVLNVGKKAEATLISNNSVRINDGELVMQGVHWRIKPNTYENVTINNGARGQKRKDAIVARYAKNSSSGIEKIELAVLQGTATTGTPVAPTPTEGDIRTGTLKHEMLLYIVELNGLNVVSVEPAFDVLMNMSMINESLSDIKDYVIESGKVPIGSTGGHNYYEKYASGKLVQWGIANCSYTDGYGIIKYAIPFAGSTKDYVLFVQGQYISGKVVEIMVASKHSTSQGYAYSRGLNGANIDTHDFDWYTVGRWK